MGPTNKESNLQAFAELATKEVTAVFYDLVNLRIVCSMSHVAN